MVEDSRRSVNKRSSVGGNRDKIVALSREKPQLCMYLLNYAIIHLNNLLAHLLYWCSIIERH